MHPEDSSSSYPTSALLDRDHARSAYLLDGFDAAAPVIHIKVGRNPVLHLSVEEARLMRDFIDAMLSVDAEEATP